MDDNDIPASGARIWPMLVYLALLAIGIPWYWPDDEFTVVFGMPAWVVVAIVVSIGASIFTAVLLHEPWPNEDQTDGNHS